MKNQGILDSNLMEYDSLFVPIDSNIIHTVFSHDITSYFWSSPFSCAIFPSSLVIVDLGSSVPIKIAMFPALFLPLIDDGHEQPKRAPEPGAEAGGGGGLSRAFRRVVGVGERRDGRNRNPHRGAPGVGCRAADRQR